jgi:hypothetical protein
MSIKRCLAAVMACLMLFSVSVFSSTVAQPPVERQVDTQSVWYIETLDSDGDVGFFTSIALDSGESPHISFYDYTNGDLNYARWTGWAWSVKTVDSNGDVGWSTSLALDSGDSPHISYYDYTNGDLKYARWNGTGWSIETVDSDGDVGRYISIALDSGDDPHISYSDDTNRDLKYARWNGTGWSIETVDLYGDVGSFTSLALDSGDNPHISYHDRTYDDLKYAYGDLRTSIILKLTISDGEVHPGEWVTLKGRLTPGLANKQIFLYYRLTLQWKSFGTAITDQQGRYSFGFKIPESANPPITVRFVAFFPGTDYHIGVVSPIRKLFITSPLT